MLVISILCTILYVWLGIFVGMLLYNACQDNNIELETKLQKWLFLGASFLWPISISLILLTVLIIGPYYGIKSLTEWLSE